MVAHELAPIKKLLDCNDTLKSHYKQLFWNNEMGLQKSLCMIDLFRFNQQNCSFEYIVGRTINVFKLVENIIKRCLVENLLLNRLHAAYDLNGWKPLAYINIKSNLRKCFAPHFEVNGRWPIHLLNLWYVDVGYNFKYPYLAWSFPGICGHKKVCVCLCSWARVHSLVFNST